MPGISTITLRLRYYSFFPWLLDHYAHNVGHTDVDVFRRFQRRSEILFALISAFSPEEENNQNDIKPEVGVSGSNWAHAAFLSGRDPILFDVAADPDAPVELKYLKNPGGALGGI